MLRPSFAPFDEYKAVRIYQRNLPHWRQEGRVLLRYLSAGRFRSAGVLQQWEYEKQLWLTARGIRSSRRDGTWEQQIGRLSEPDQRRFHKHFNRLFHLALDEGHGACHLNAIECLKTVREALLENDGETYHLGDFIVMPNHVHLLMVPSPGCGLERILKAIKGSAARRCNQTLGQSGRFWQPDSYDHIVRTLDQLAQYRHYVAENPGKAGISVHPDALYHADWMDAWHP